MAGSNGIISPALYMHEPSAEFLSTADVSVLVDESSQELPAHSQFIASFSNVLARAVRELQKSSHKVKLSLHHCDTRDAVNFLSCIYTRNGRIKSLDCAVSLTKVASHFNDESLRGECDSYLAAHADAPDSFLLPRVSPQPVLPCTSRV